MVETPLPWNSAKVFVQYFCLSKYLLGANSSYLSDLRCLKQLDLKVVLPMLHYEKFPMQYTEIFFFSCKNTGARRLDPIFFFFFFFFFLHFHPFGDAIDTFMQLLYL